MPKVYSNKNPGRCDAILNQTSKKFNTPNYNKYVIEK